MKIGLSSPTMSTSSANDTRKVTLHAGAVFLVDVDAGRDVQRFAFAAALDEVDAHGELVNLELLIEPKKGNFRARRVPLP